MLQIPKDKYEIHVYLSSKEFSILFIRNFTSNNKLKQMQKQ